MNIRLKHMLLSAFLLVSFAAIAQTSHVTVGGSVFGGGNLAPVGRGTAVLIDQENAEIMHDVYGGGAKAEVDTLRKADPVPALVVGDTILVTILQGTIHGDVYGGGLGNADTAANVYGPVFVNIGSGTVDGSTGFASSTSGSATLGGSVYGCNNLNGSPKDNVFVNIFQTAHNDDNTYPSTEPSTTELLIPAADNAFAIKTVYGGGNQAAYAPVDNIKTALVHIYTCYNTIQTVYGGGNAADATKVHTIIDGGRFDRVFGGGNGYSETGNHDNPTLPNYNPGADISVSATTDIHGGLYRQVFGGSNQFGDVEAAILNIDETSGCTERIAEAFGGANEANIHSSITTTLACSDVHFVNFYGGSNLADITGDVTLNIHGGNFSNVFGGSKGRAAQAAVGEEGQPGYQPAVSAKPANIDGNVTLNLYGGTMENAFGGSDVNGNITGVITVNMLDQNETGCGLQVDTIYGGGRDAFYRPSKVNGEKIVSPVVNLWNGTVGEKNDSDEVTVPGCVFGGGKGADAEVCSHPKVMIGDTITTDPNHDPNNKITVLGHVFGGGNLAAVDGIDSVLMLKANSEVVNLFGGGNNANADTTVVMMTVAAEIDTIFGGGNLAGLTGTALVEVTNGTMRGGIYGGSNKSGNVQGDITVNITGNADNHTTIGASDEAANIHGGGYGSGTETQGHVTVNFGEIAYDDSDHEIHLAYPVVYGDIYGGSALGHVNHVSSTGTDVDTTLVNILNGEVKKTTSGTVAGGNIYGGGLGKKQVGETPGIAALVNGKVYVNIGDTLVGNSSITYLGKAVIEGDVFGCNNLNGTPKDSVFVNIFQTNHSGTNFYPSLPSGQTAWTPALLAASSQTYAIQSVFGGGNQASYTPVANRCTQVHVFGCENTIQDVFGGGNAANVGATGEGANSANTFILIDGGRFNRVFGGGNGNPQAANIYGIATTTINAGLIDTIFGGSNKEGSITATSLNLDKVGDCDDEVFRVIFGGANLAPIAGNLETTIKCGVGDIGEIYGGSNKATITGNVQTNINGGTIQYAYGGSKGDNEHNVDAVITGSTQLNLYGGTVKHAFGGSNLKGNITGQITVNVLDTVSSPCNLVLDTVYGGGNVAPYTPTNPTILSPAVNLICGTVNKFVYGGGLGSTAVVTANPVVTIGYDASMATLLSDITAIGYTLPSSPQAVVTEDVYGGGDAAPVTGSTTIIFQNTGTAANNIFGGGNQAGVSGSTAVTVSNGTVGVNVYGGCNSSGTVGSTTNVTLTGGTVSGSAFGGGFGVNTVVTGKAHVDVNGGAVSDSVYGGGNLGVVNGGTYVKVQSGSVTGCVYGGGKDANVTGIDSVFIKGGSIGGSVYGGGLGESTRILGDVAVIVGEENALTGATITGDVYGGSAKGMTNCNSAGNAQYASTTKTDVILNKGTINGSLYGGGHGPGNELAHVWGPVQVTVNSGSVLGSVYGCNNAAGMPKSTVAVDIYGTDSPDSGCALANVFGGGNEAAYNGTPVVTIHNCGNSIGFVYGGGNKAKVEATDVTVYGSDTIGYVFGGGNGQGVAPDFEMVHGNVNAKIRGGKITHVFGGNNTSGMINGSITLDINKQTESGSGHSSCDMKLGEVYGGGNEADGKAGAITIGCTGTWTTGHNTHNSIDNRIGYELEGIGTVYGGANRANIGTLEDPSNITLNIRSGIIDTVFGGNNQEGTINGTITVNINKNNDASCASSWYVGNVFGGGNQAVYGTAGNNYPQVNILNGTVSFDVFGGGLGSTGNAGKVTGNPQVTINGSGAAVDGGVYGGGSLAPTQGNPMVTQRLGATAKVFGGGKAADVDGAPTVAINGGTVSSGVYGGCDSQGNVSGNVTVNVTGGTLGSQANLELPTPVTVDVYGGGYGENTSTSGNVDVTIGTLADTHSDVPGIYGNVYGGSALGDVNTNYNNHTTVNIYNGTLYSEVTQDNGFDVYNGGNVFGGGLGQKDNPATGGVNEAIEAKVNGVVTVNIGAPSRSGRDLNPDEDENQGMATIQGNVYGCNNTNGSPQDSVTVNIYRTYRSDSAQIYVPSGMDTVYAIANVFGGGNQANYVPRSTATHRKLKVMIHGCYNSVRRVFGGSNAAASGNASVHTTVSTNIDGGRFYQVFGGGNGEVSAADIYGNLDLQIHGGIVGQFYGASNQNGSITGNINTVVDNTSGCESIQITEYFCGGNYSNVYGDLISTITCSDGMNVTSLYGGCNQANIYGDVVLNLFGGTYTNVFGGSKGVAGGISADILKVTQAVQTAHPDLNLTVGHGGNVTLNLYGGTIENVFGGSNVHGNIEGNITVNVIDAESATCPLYVTNIYGGSNLTDYVPDSTNHVATTEPTRISPVVNVMHAKNGILGNVYGGSKGETGVATPTKVMANPKVNIGYDSNTMGSISNNSSLIYQLTNNPNYQSTTLPTDFKATIQGSVFGGGDAAEVTGNTDIRLNKHTKVIGNVYGGGNMGEVQGNTKVIINGKRQ